MLYSRGGVVFSCFFVIVVEIRGSAICQNLTSCRQRGITAYLPDETLWQYFSVKVDNRLSYQVLILLRGIPEVLHPARQGHMQFSNFDFCE